MHRHHHRAREAEPRNPIYIGFRTVHAPGGRHASPTRPDRACAADTTAQVARLRSQPFGESNIAALTGVLTRAGVGIANAGADGHQPVRVNRWQLQHLALQAANGGGIRGEDLDRLTGTPVNSPPIYDLIGGWIRVYGSPGSRFSAALLGQHAAGAVLDEEQHVQAAQEHRIDTEEVRGEDRRGLPGQERPPGLPVLGRCPRRRGSSKSSMVRARA